MNAFMVTWTDIFNAIGDFSLWTFKGMRSLGFGPDIVFSALVIFAIGFWTYRLMVYKKEAQRNGTLE
ncbi:MAG: hypothetical protein EBQ77_04435 [Sphingobacteriia bacterium]|jgi:hypothetical protein|nr:hypothetical protein [Sphingobacteriia bacterium]